MRPFDYVRAEDAADAAAKAGEGGARFLGGGTNLIDLMKHEIEAPGRLVDVRHLDFGGIEDDGEDGLRIGAQVSNTELASDARVRTRWSVLSQALLSGATVQLRNRATTGGNFLQRTRCYYFYDTHMPCNKREPGSGCAAIGGANRLHAILGASDSCIATHPSDMAVAMAALDAEALTVKPDGSRRAIPAEGLHRLPGDRPQDDTVLEPGELIEAARLPAPPPGRHVYRKVRDRASYAFALVSAAVVLDVRDGAVASVRLALGGVAHKPWRARAAEEMLVGGPATREAFAAGAQAELKDADGERGPAFKTELAQRTIVAALSQAAGLDSGDAP